MTPRSKYVSDVLGLAHDPFRFVVAEQEERAQPDDFPVYFVEPEPELWQRLLDSNHFAVFGAYGSGKSTLRLNAAYEIAHGDSSVLGVTCEFAARDSGNVEEFVAQEIAKDLFIRTVERFDPVNIDRGQDRLSMEILAGIMFQPLRKVACRVAATIDGERIELLWEALGRAPGAGLVSSSPLRDFLHQLLDQLPHEMPRPDLAVSIQAAGRLGYRTIALLADGFDAVERRPDRMLTILEQLIALAHLYPRVLILKLFLPADLKESAAPLLRDLVPGSPPEARTSELSWTRESLGRVFARRFRAAQRPDILAPEDLLSTEQEDTALTAFWVRVAGSPRALLAAISAAIDAHVETSEAGQIAIESASWNRTGTS